MDTLMNKREELKITINTHDPDIIMLNEIYPKTKHTIDPNIEFNIPGYISDFNNNSARGVAIYTKENIDVLPCTLNQTFDTNTSLNENIWKLLKINIRILIGCVYRSDSNNKKDSIDQLNNLFNAASQIKCDKILITGDFNLPSIHWNNLSDTKCENELKFIDFKPDYELT